MPDQRLAFTKMSGAGNDFIVIDNRPGIVAEEGRGPLFERWCRRRVGVGADGVLLVEPPSGAEAHFRMRYYNADGGEAESCGNGARCIARFAHSIGAAPDPMAFETQAGLYGASMLGEEVVLSLTDPGELKQDVELGLEGIPGGRVDAIDTGVPHAVVFVEDLEAADVGGLGARIRHHEAFAPAGVNANFAAPGSEGEIGMRTFERGVEAETLACGTGAVAVALAAARRGLAASPVRVRTRGGPILTIHFEALEERFTNVRLQGEARVVYEGALPSVEA